MLAVAAANSLQPESWALIGLGAVVLIYLTVVRPARRGRKDPLDKPPAFAGLAQQRAVERQMQGLLVELSEMARQITAQLDTRAARLEALIRQADEKIAQLKSAAGDDAAAPSSPPSAVAPVVAPAPLPSPDPDPRHAEVYALADQGRDACAIAAQLGRPSGEIELILALRGPRR